MPLRTLTRLAGALLLVAAPLRGQLVTNGGFESPVVPNGSSNLYFTGSSFGGWDVVGAPGLVGLTSGTFTQFGFTFPAHGGAQWLDLTGFSNTPTGVEQTVATTAGTTYALSFWVGNIVDPTGLFGTTSTVDVLVNGTALASATNAGGVGSSMLTWQQFTRSFTATSASTTLTFLNADPVTDNSNGLDDVALSAPMATTAPEPASVALVATGLLGLAAATRRRRA